MHTWLPYAGLNRILGWKTLLSPLITTDDEDTQESQLVVGELENIDDECDSKGISFVKIDNDDEAKEYGIDTLPTLVYFEKGVPSVYSGEEQETQNLPCVCW